MKNPNYKGPITNEQDPAIWFCENEDLWDNMGDHIEFKCAPEEVPENVKEAVEAYRQSQIKAHEQAMLLNKMGLNKRPQHEGPAPIRRWQNRKHKKG